MNAKTAFFGEGIYMTDMLDYAGFYAFEPEEGNKFKNHHAIRKKDDSFTIVASQVFYDNSKFEYCYQMMKGTQIQQNGVRFVNGNAEGLPSSKIQFFNRHESYSDGETRTTGAAKENYRG